VAKHRRHEVRGTANLCLRKGKGSSLAGRQARS
jgi:hypothetical protein